MEAKEIIKITDNFYINGEKFQIISGTIHYFRVVPEYWRDRLEKLKAMGCNTVETYIAWNMHEPREGEFCFEGEVDFRKFLEIAQELGLYVILRPSPFICAEWEFGGFPAWLLTKPGIRLRCNNPVYLDYVARYYDKLIPLIVPYQITSGGPVILVQVENEYGSYGNDKEYLKALRNMLVERGINVPLVTSDGPEKQLVGDGNIETEGVWPTANFGSRGAEKFAEFKGNIGDWPLMCMEFWVGWFDHWGDEEHHVVGIEEHAKDLEDMLERGHVNIYMFHGGTNFGFMSGSNYEGRLLPDVTSYDYGALITEDGQITEKYRAFREVIRKFRDIPEVEFTTPIIRKDYGVCKVQEKVGLFEVLDLLDTPVTNPVPMSMEELGQNYGYTLYRTNLNRGKKVESCRLKGCADRAILFAEGKQLDILNEYEMDRNVAFELQEERAEFAILTENLGRVNFGPELEYQKKGIRGGVLVNGTYQMGWDMYRLPMDNLEKLDYSRGYQEGLPAFYRFTFDVEESGDTFLDVTGFGKGFAVLNGKNIGRFWEIGPQKRLYIPAPFLKKGENELILFESDGKAAEEIRLTDTPDLG